MSGFIQLIVNRRKNKKLTLANTLLTKLNQNWNSIQKQDTKNLQELFIKFKKKELLQIVSEDAESIYALLKQHYI